MKFEHVKIAIVPSDDAPVAIMNWVVVGRGDVLPEGALWLESGWWARPLRSDLIQKSVDKTFADRPPPKSWHIVDEVPADRTYRNAWMRHAESGAIVHDMGKARELHRQHLRNQRTERLVKLDAEWMAATRKKDSATVEAIDLHKQQLLDATADPRIEAAQTVEELKQVALPERA